MSVESVLAYHKAFEHMLLTESLEDLLTDPALNTRGDVAYYYGKPIGIQCPYCDTFGIKPVKPLVPGAPKTCPNCGGWL